MFRPRTPAERPFPPVLADRRGGHRLGIAGRRRGADRTGLELLIRCGVEAPHLLLNSVGCPLCRPAFIEKLRQRLQEVKSGMCEDCRRRAETNPLRVLDCKVPEDQPIIDSLPSILDHLGPECATHFAAVRELLDARDIRYEIRPRLVRGLDYYTKTTFEVVHGALGAQNSVLGGGRYDGLAESLGSRVPLPGIGFSIGEDRLVMTIEEQLDAASLSPLDLYVVPMGPEAVRHARVARARVTARRRGRGSLHRRQGQARHGARQ